MIQLTGRFAAAVSLCPFLSQKSTFKVVHYGFYIPLTFDMHLLIILIVFLQSLFRERSLFGIRIRPISPKPYSINHSAVAPDSRSSSKLKTWNQSRNKIGRFHLKDFFAFDNHTTTLILSFTSSHYLLRS